MRKVLFDAEIEFISKKEIVAFSWKTISNKFLKSNLIQYK